MSNTLGADIRREQRIWAKSDSLRFFQAHRRDVTDLYLSERLFLPDLLPQVSSCLDVGCAAGGFSRIMKTLNPRLAYTGLDINEELVALARRDFPDSRFEAGDGVHYSTPPGSFDLVFCSGTLHLNSRYALMLQAAYEQARRFLLCDLRLTEGAGVTGRFRLDFDGKGEEAAVELPYVVLNLDEALQHLKTLDPAPARIVLRGYPHPVSRMASGVPEAVIMAFVLIEKGTNPLHPSRVEADIREREAWERLLIPTR